eukprot:1155037-Pelagomonas_calceolata.AAC.9
MVCRIVQSLVLSFSLHSTSQPIEDRLHKTLRIVPNLYFLCNNLVLDFKFMLACYKQVRFVSVTNPDVLKGREELEILISADKEKNTITIE